MVRGGRGHYVGNTGEHTGAICGCGHMYGSARGRQILQYKINPNPTLTLILIQAVHTV